MVKEKKTPHPVFITILPSSLPLLAALSFTAVNGQQHRRKKTRDIMRYN